MPAPSRRTDILISAGVGAVSLAVYVRTLLPGTGYSGDTAKWQFLGAVGGIAHATGYPLYIAVDQAWVSIVPFGSVAWRVNLLSALLAATAVGVLFLLLRILDVRRSVAAATALVFAFSATFWSQAVVAEVYALHALFLVTVTACLARWRAGAANSWLLAGLGLYALSFGHHLTTAVALPGVVWIVWSDRRRAWRLGTAAFVVAAVALSACQYLYLLRLSDVGGYQESTIDTLGDVVGYATGGDFKSSMLAFGWHDLLRGRLRLLESFVRHEYSVLLIPIALGVVRGLRSPSAATRAVAVYVAWLAVGTSLYVLQYDVPDLVVFCIPLFLSLAVFLGLGVDAAVGWLEDRWAGDRRLTWGVPAALAAVVVTVIVVNWSGADQRGNVADAERIERALDAAGTCAVLLTDEYHDSEYFWYYLLAEREAERDLVLANQVWPAQVEEYLATGGGDVGWVARDLGACDGPSVYTATSSQAEALTAWGLSVTEVAEDVWRVEA
jgi:4-amino-4-deoxy-L-arabinose transferase-like glycosyltransferase